MSEKDKIRSREWSRRMTREGRCHYCGKPASLDYARGCDEHKEAMRVNARRTNLRLREKRLAAGLCVNCGRRSAREGKQSCLLCARRRAVQLRDWQESQALPLYDLIVDEGLVDVKTAAGIIGIDRTGVNRLIKLGILKVKMRGGNGAGKFWLKESAVRRYRRARLARLLNIVRCERCGHEWSPRYHNGRRLRCPNHQCGSYHVKPYRKPTDEYSVMRPRGIIYVGK